MFPFTFFSVSIGFLFLDLQKREVIFVVGRSLRVVCARFSCYANKYIPTWNSYFSARTAHMVWHLHILNEKGAKILEMTKQNDYKYTVALRLF